jgi:hypothetical protein
VYLPLGLSSERELAHANSSQQSQCSGVTQAKRKEDEGKKSGSFVFLLLFAGHSSVNSVSCIFDSICN